MGARPSSFKQGGGFLNGVAGVIADYQLTDEFNGEAFAPGKIPSYDNPKVKIDKPHNLNVLLSVRVDGADEDTVTTLKAAGDFDGWKVSDDGHEVIGVDEDGNELPDKGFGASSAFSKFVTSLCHPVNGGLAFPEDRFPEDRLNWEAMIGTRVRFVQQVDQERTKKFGQKLNKKSGKAYDRKDLVVEEVYDLPETAEAAAPAPVKGGKAASKATAPKGKKATEPEIDVPALAMDTLKSILDDNDNQIIKSKVSMKVLTALMKHPQREDVRTWLASDANLASLVDDGVITYNKAKGVIALAE